MVVFEHLRLKYILPVCQRDDDNAACNSAADLETLREARLLP